MSSPEKHKKKKSPQRIESLEAKVSAAVEEEKARRLEAEKKLQNLKRLIVQQEEHEKQAAADQKQRALAGLAQFRRLAAEQDVVRAARYAEAAAARRVRRELALAEARAERAAKQQRRREREIPAPVEIAPAKEEERVSVERLRPLFEEFAEPEPPAPSSPPQEEREEESMSMRLLAPLIAVAGEVIHRAQTSPQRLVDAPSPAKDENLLESAEDILADSRRQRQVMGGIRWADYEGAAPLREVRHYRPSDSPPEQKPAPAVDPDARTPAGCTTEWKTKVCGHPLVSGRGRCRLKTRLTKYCWLHTRRDVGARPTDSAIAGKGLIATRDLPAGTNIPYGGQMMSNAQLNRLCPDPYTAEYAVQYSRNKVIDARVSDTREPGAYANDPRGTGKKANAKLSIDTRNKKANIKLTKDVKAHEEILVPYDEAGDEYWSGAQFTRRRPRR